MTPEIPIRNIDYSQLFEDGRDSSFYEVIADGVFDYIRNNNSASFQDIIAFVGGGERRVVRLLDQMVELNILRFSEGTFSLPDSKENYPITPSGVRCDQCDGKMIKIDGKMKDVLTFMKTLSEERPKSTFVFDQRPVNPETVVRRVGYAVLRGDLQNKRVALIGDDDLTSVAIAKTGLAQEITVFDIDERILDYIRQLSNRHDLKIQTVRQDLLMDIPEAYLNHFDTFITDPTPTTKPLLLFTTRGLEMLEKAPGKTGYISLYPSHMASNTEFQSELSKMNILITDLIPFFNQYEVINQTLAEKDVELLKKYDGWGKTISFYEYFMRIQTERGVNVPHLNLSAADIMGKATKGILEKPSNDPVLAKSDTPDFIKEYAGTLEKEVIEADSSKEALTGERPYFRHFVIEIKCTFDEANSLEWVKNKVTSFIDHFDIQTIKSTEHLFSPQGITLLYIISSSHLAVHTWPENNYMHIDFLTCAYNKNFENLDPLVQKVFPGLESKAYELKY